MAARQGMTARKMKRRDHYATDYGRWSLTWTHGGAPITDGYDLTADKLERFLTRDTGLYAAIVEQMAAEQGAPVSQPEAVRRYVNRTTPPQGATP